MKQSLIFAFIIYVSVGLFLGGLSLPGAVTHRLEIFPDISFGKKCPVSPKIRRGFWYLAGGKLLL